MVQHTSAWQTSLKHCSLAVQDSPLACCKRHPPSTQYSSEKQAGSQPPPEELEEPPLVVDPLPELVGPPVVELDALLVLVVVLVAADVWPEVEPDVEDAPLVELDPELVEDVAVPCVEPAALLVVAAVPDVPVAP